MNNLYRAQLKEIFADLKDIDMTEVVEQYTEMKVMGEPLKETGVKYITSRIGSENRWVGKHLNEVEFMPDMVPVMVMRGDRKLVPNDDLIFEENYIIHIEEKN